MEPLVVQDTRPVALRDALGRLAALAEAFNAPDLATRARAALEPLEKGELWIVVLGQFKRGKSTLLNALLGEAILPAGVIPVTSVVTHLRWAPETQGRVVYLDGREEDITPAELSAFVSEEGNPGNRKGVSQVVVGVPSPILEGGVVLVDTPGIGSMDAAATERAYAFLPRVDAGILVLSPDPPMGEAEGAYLEALLGHTDHVLYVLNKVDLCSEEAAREAMEFNRRLAADLQSVPPEQVEMIQVSARLAVEGKGGGVEELRTYLTRFVQERGESVARDVALRRLNAVGGELGARLEVEARAIQLSDGELADRLGRLKALRSELRARREEARPLLLDAIRRMVEDATESLRREAAAASGPLTRSLVEAVESHPELGNAALARCVGEHLAEGVRDTFDAWWGGEGNDMRRGLREAMSRCAATVDATNSALSEWVEKELGVALPPPPPPTDLVDSHDFYYYVQALKAELTVDLLSLLLPRSLYRGRLRRRAAKLVAEDLERNVGRIRGDLLYRMQETARAFLSDLESRAMAAGDGMQEALQRAHQVRDGEQRESAAALKRLSEGRRELDLLLGGELPPEELELSAHVGGHPDAAP